MTKSEREKLLKDKRVVEEINRHLWIESEKAGFDIGFERAAEDWLSRFSQEWLRHNIMEGKKGAKSPAKPRKRGIKSYLK